MGNAADAPQHNKAEGVPSGGATRGAEKMSNIIVTNRTLSFVVLAQGVIHTFEEKPRSVKPQGFIPAGTEITLVSKEKAPESLGKWPNTNKGTVEVEGEELTVYVHDNHLITREQQKTARDAAGAGVALKKQETPAQKLERLALEMQRAQAEVEAEERAMLSAARALLEKHGMKVQAPAITEASDEDVELETELKSING